MLGADTHEAAVAIAASPTVALQTGGQVLDGRKREAYDV